MRACCSCAFRAPATRAVLLGLAIAATIAGYTVVDKRGIEHASALAYQFLILAPGAVVYTLGVARVRGIASLRAALNARAVVAAAAAFVAYLFVLLALRLADAAPVAAVRESGVVIAVAFAAIFLGERVGRARAPGPRWSWPGSSCYPSDTTFRAVPKWARRGHFL